MSAPFLADRVAHLASATLVGHPVVAGLVTIVEELERELTLRDEHIAELRRPGNNCQSGHAETACQPVATHPAHTVRYPGCRTRTQAAYPRYDQHPPVTRLQKMKISGSFRTQARTTRFSRMPGLAETPRQQERNLLVVRQLGPGTPSLWPHLVSL